MPISLVSAAPMPDYPVTFVNAGVAAGWVVVASEDWVGGPGFDFDGMPFGELHVRGGFLWPLAPNVRAGVSVGGRISYGRREELLFVGAHAREERNERVSGDMTCLAHLEWFLGSQIDPRLSVEGGLALNLGQYIRAEIDRPTDVETVPAPVLSPELILRLGLGLGPFNLFAEGTAGVSFEVHDRSWGDRTPSLGHAIGHFRAALGVEGHFESPSP